MNMSVSSFVSKYRPTLEVPVITNTSYCENRFRHPGLSVKSMSRPPCNLRTFNGVYRVMESPCCSTNGTFGTKKIIAFPSDACRVEIHLMSKRLISVFPDPVFNAAIMFPKVSEWLKGVSREAIARTSNLSELSQTLLPDNDEGEGYLRYHCQD